MEPETWRFGSDDFPFEVDDFGVHNVNFQGCRPSHHMILVVLRMF